MREHGLSDYHQVAIAVLEVDGSISFLKYDDLKPTASTTRIVLRLSFAGLKPESAPRWWGPAV